MTQKHIRQYVGLFAAVIVYFLVHEGAHLLYAVACGAFRQIRFLGLGVQIDIYAERMSDLQLGLFCIVGSLATAAAAYLLTFLSERIGQRKSAMLRACMYYITIALLLIDPLYLSLLFPFFSGGDMNGISLLLPLSTARALYTTLLGIHSLLLWKFVLPKYKASFAQINNIK